MADFGTDISTFPDLDPYFSLTSGTRAVGEAIQRRLETPRGGGLFYDLDYGYDLRSLFNSNFTPSRLAAIASEVENEALKDERVDDATCTVTLDGNGKLRVRLQLETGEGPYTLVLVATALTLEALAADGITG